MTDAISIGCQAGGPEASVVGDEKVRLFQALARHMTGTHCVAVDSYSIVLRVDGSLDKFGDEGPAKLRFARKQRYITVDIQIPEAAWAPKSPRQLRPYLLAQVRSALQLCVSRLQRGDLHVDVVTFWKEFESAAVDYLSTTDSGLLR